MIFFFIPFGIMAILVPTMIIASIVQAFKVMKNPQAFANEQMAQESGQTVNVASLAQQAGYQVNHLPSNDPSTAQYLLESDQRKILVKVLPSGQTYRNGIVQDLSKGLGQYLAQEAWVIQTPPTFTDNDLNFARFYNVKLIDEQTVITLLSPVSSITKN
jgi:S-formylglutathione hydrolase FrmB